MKVLFSKPGSSACIVDKDRMILCFDEQYYYDLEGNAITEDPELDLVYEKIKNDEQMIRGKFEEDLIPESTIEPECDVDFAYGNYGFKDASGEFVIEPQYASAEYFTCGLAAVNLNRTWYTTEDGMHDYDNHFGYINKLGKTVIPFAYQSAIPFNDYGVALVETQNDIFMIDTEGKPIAGTEELFFLKYVNYDTRFVAFLYKSDYNQEVIEQYPVGVYDMKNRRIVLEPSLAFIEETSKNYVRVAERRDGHQNKYNYYYIDESGQKLFPWLIDKKFDKIEEPNKALLSIVAVWKYKEVSECCFFLNCYIDKLTKKKYRGSYVYGLYSSKEEFILPLDYDQIFELTDNHYACVKDGMISVIELEESDFN